MFFVYMNDNMYDDLFCAYKYYTLIWKYILRKFCQLTNVYVQYMHNL
jgi:hypothetical protein